MTPRRLGHKAHAQHAEKQLMPQWGSHHGVHSKHCIQTKDFWVKKRRQHLDASGPKAATNLLQIVDPMHVLVRSQVDAQIAAI